jgi:hypothetical protein
MRAAANRVPVYKSQVQCSCRLTVTPLTLPMNWSQYLPAPQLVCGMLNQLQLLMGPRSVGVAASPAHVRGWQQQQQQSQHDIV